MEDRKNQDQIIERSSSRTCRPVDIDHLPAVVNTHGVKLLLTFLKTSRIKFMFY